jgi:hypothetical protein
MSTQEKLDELPYQQFAKKREEQVREQERDRDRVYKDDSPQVLTELLNLPQSSGPSGEDYAQANADFDQRYKMSLRGWPAAALSGVFLNAVETYREDRGRGLREINSLVGVILNERQPGPLGLQRRAALRVNIVGGQKIEVEPRDLLDAVAVKFLDVYRSISRCKREGCNRLFIRDYPNDKYCSRPCAGEARLIAQRDFMRKKRAKDAQQKKSAAKAKLRRKR